MWLLIICSKKKIKIKNYLQQRVYFITSTRLLT